VPRPRGALQTAARAPASPSEALAAPPWSFSDHVNKVMDMNSRKTVEIKAINQPPWIEKRGRETGDTIE